MKRFLKRAALVLLGLMALLGAGIYWITHDLDAVSNVIRRAYDDVAFVTPEALSDRLAQAETVRLLDVRHREEYAVSHLPGALQIDMHRDEDALREALSKAAPDLSPETPIVVYCSVGWRSAAMARRLSEMGYTQVQNLEGSIFAWAHADLPLENADGPTSTVHPYSALWSGLCDPHCADLK